MRKLGIMIVTSMLVLSLFACSKREENGKKVLVMGTSADYKPYEYIDAAKSEKIVGFDVDIAKYIGKELGYEIKVKDIDFSGLLPALEAKKVDFVMAGMTPTPEREKNAAFTDVYFIAKNVIVSKSSLQNINELKGKTIGVQTGSIQEGKAKELQKTTSFTITDRTRIPELFEELKAGRIDAILMEDAVAKGYIAKLSQFKSTLIPEIADEAGAAMAFPKNNKEVEAFNKVIQKMKQNGEMDKLAKKWFSGE